MYLLVENTISAAVSDDQTYGNSSSRKNEANTALSKIVIGDNDMI